MDSDTDNRRRSRAKWLVRRTKLGDESRDVLTSADERLAMMWELAQQAWAMAGRELPSYERSQMPVRILRGERTGRGEVGPE